MLIVNIKHLENESEWAEANDLDDLATRFQEVKLSFADYKTRVNNNICDPYMKAQLLNEVEDLLNRCLRLYDITMGDAPNDPVKDCPLVTDLGREDSVSQGATSTTSSRLLARQIELDRGDHRNFKLFTPTMWLGRRWMLRSLRLTSRPSRKSGK